MKDIKIELADYTICQNDEIDGKIQVGFPGRYDGVVINAQILDSNEHVRYVSYNDTPVPNQVARLFVSGDKIEDGAVRFTARIGFEPEREYEVKFRASIIEQHKEVASDIIFAKYLKEK